MKRLANLLLVLLTLPALGMAGDSSLTLSTLDDGSTVARDAGGALVWERYSSDPADIVQTLSGPRARPLSTTTPTWDPLIELDSAPPSYLRGPIFDSLGNAWVVINDNVNLIAIESSGASGAWQLPHVIGPALPNFIYTVGVAVDQAGGFYVTYGGAQSGSSFPLMWTKYTPVSGWQAPALIYSSSLSFTETFPVVDSTGRLVVVFNANGVSSVASDSAQSSWGKVQVISPLSASPVLPSVAGNKSGTLLALVYLRERRGLQYGFFNSTTGQWNSFASVPGSTKATFSNYTVENAFPLTVDEAGNVTIVAALTQGLKFTVGGFRYEGGQWTEKNLLPASRSRANVDNFGSTTINVEGSVLVAVPTNFESNVNNISVFRDTPGQGWDTEVAATYNSSGASRCSVAWFESTEAVAVYLDYSTTADLLQPALYSNGAWSGGPAIPGNLFDVTSPKLGSAPSGQDLLGMPDSGVYVTWLRP